MTNRAQFKCQKNPHIIFQVNSSGNEKASDTGATLLNSDAELELSPPSAPLPCKILTTKAGGTPVKCSCTLSGWKNCADNTISGKKMLTEKSFCICNNPIAWDTKISVFISGNCKAKKDSVPLINITSVLLEAADDKKDAPIKESKESTDSGLNKSDQIVDAPKDNGKEKALGSRNNKNKGKSASKKNAAKLCAYSPNKEECKNCKFPQTSCELPERNESINAKVLRVNYNNYYGSSNEQADVHYRELLHEYDEIKQEHPPWNYAAHHLIPANEVFGNKFPELVQLANFYGYDINHEYNCIMLPTNTNKDAEGNTVKKEKLKGEAKDRRSSISAYDAMSLSQSQWHSGPHNYKLANKADLEKIRKQIRLYTGNKPKVIMNYEELVNAKLKAIVSAMSRTNRVCRNSEQQKMAFIYRLEKVMSEIKERLGAFSEKPHHSYPYFVSKQAYRFAFEVPRTNKLIILDMKNGKLYIEKYRATRFGKTMEQGDGLALTIIDGDNKKCFDMQNEDDIKECIIFSQNINFFISMSQEAVGNLRKAYNVDDNHLIDCSTDGIRYKEQDYSAILSSSNVQSRLLVMFRDYPADNTSEAKMVRDRLLALQKGGVQ